MYLSKVNADRAATDNPHGINAIVENTKLNTQSGEPKTSLR
jgi:hypothetical protein